MAKDGPDCDHPEDWLTTAYDPMDRKWIHCDKCDHDLRPIYE